MVTAAPTRNVRRGAARREAIVAAATHLFETRGYLATSVADIAREARASKETIYRHFGDKEGLIAAVMDTELRHVESDLRFDLPADASVENVLTAVGRAYIKLATRPRVLALYRVLASEVGRMPGLGRLFTAKVTDELARRIAVVLAWQQDRGCVEIRDPELTASIFMGMLQARLWSRALIEVRIEDLDAQVEKVVPEVVRIFLDGIRA